MLWQAERSAPATDNLLKDDLPRPGRCLAEWVRESSHHGILKTIKPQKMRFECPGAVHFEITFDDNTELIKGSDKLEIRDGLGSSLHDLSGAPHADFKPQLFIPGECVECEFTAAGLKLRWGYKFTIRAMGHHVPDVPWYLDVLMDGLQALGSDLADIMYSPKRVDEKAMELCHSIKQNVIIVFDAAEVEQVSTLWSQGNWSVLFERAAEKPVALGHAGPGESLAWECVRWPHSVSLSCVCLSLLPSSHVVFCLAHHSV